RGAGLVGLRGSLPEVGAWFVSCLVFGGLHAVNALFGQGLGATGYQIVMAFLAGSVFYLTRRITGSLVWCMLLHAFWDFSTLAAASGGPAAPSSWGLLPLLQWPALALALLGVALVLRRGALRPAPRVA
ncbi:MAG: CPBP family intramembrane glutamic endopeptidase, partial [Pseudonocardia sediminis]